MKWFAIISRTFELAACIALGFFLLWTTKWDMGNTLPFYGVGLLKIVSAVILILLLGRFFHKTIFHSSKAEWVKDLSLTIFSIFVTLLILECVFFFIPVSQVSGTTLGYKRWMDYYWKPLNEMEFRDKKLNDPQLKYQRRIIAVGDSFTAGHGIKSVAERYTDQLQNKLPSNYRVINIGKDGVDSSTEMYRLLNFPIKPDIIIFQYYGNDIEGVCVAGGREAERDANFAPYKDYPEFKGSMKWLVKNSYFLNFIYWYAIPKKDVSYFDFVIPCFNDPKIKVTHFFVLKKVVDFARANNAPLVVVLFPFMSNIEESSFYMNDVESFFKQQGVPVINVGEIAKNIPVKKRIVGKLDSHASPLIHRIIADELYKIIQTNGYMK